MAGGAATTAGVRFQDTVAAWFAVRILADSAAAPVAGLPDNTRLNFLLAETTQPIDDLNVGTSADGLICVQAKTSLSLSTNDESELRKVINQFVRQVVQGCPDGNGHRAFDLARDRLILAVSGHAPATIRVNLKTVLERLESASPSTLPGILAAMGGSERAAYDTLRVLFNDQWAARADTGSSDEAFLFFVSGMRILVLDLSPDGTDLRAAHDLLRNAVLHEATQTGAAWATIAELCRNLSPERTGADREYLRRILQETGVLLEPPRSYRDDIARARRYTVERLAYLRTLSVIRFADAPDGEIKLKRDAQSELEAMARNGHVLVIGAPGAGKSGCIHDVAASLSSTHDTLVIPVDRMDDSSNLHAEFGLTRAFTLTDLLVNWSGDGDAYLFIDALDAARTKGSLQRLCEDLGSIMERAPRWKIITSIREFDLQHSRDAQRLFAGDPHADLNSPRFGSIRHIHVPLLSDDELARVRDQASAVGDAVSQGGEPLNELARNLFNLRLLADLIENSGTAGLSTVTTQVELLGLYWTKRVVAAEAPHTHVALLSRIVDALKSSRQLTTPKTPLLLDLPIDGPSLDQLLSDGVLIETDAVLAGAEQQVSFAHNILFDYAVARLWLQDLPVPVIDELTDPATDDLLLALRPSVDLAFSRLWHEPNDPTRASFWTRTFEFQRTRLVGRIIPAGVAASLLRNSEDIRLVTDAIVAGRDHADSILSHVITAGVMLDDDPGADMRMLGRESAEWMELASTLAQNAMETMAWQIRTLLVRIVRAPEMLSESERLHAGDAARRLLTFARTHTEHRGSIPIAMHAVCHTAVTDSVASLAVLLPFLEAGEMESIGYQTLEDLTEHFAKLAVLDAGFALKLSHATFTSYASRDEQVPMGNRILPLTFNKHDMLEMARTHIADAFPGVVRADPILGVRLAGQILNDHSEHDRTGGLPDRLFEFQCFGGRAVLVPDYSYVSADQSYVTHEAWWKVLRALHQGLQDAAIDSPESLPQILQAFRESFTLAAGWRVLLDAGAEEPETLGVSLQELLVVRGILDEPDTQMASKKLLSSVYSLLPAERREEIEAVIMSLATFSGELPEEYATLRRDRLLGCLPRKHVVSSVASARLEELVSQDAVPPNDPPVSGGFRFISEDERLKHEGVDLAASQNLVIRDLTQQLRDFKAEDQATRLSAAAVADFFPTVEVIADQIQNAGTLGIDATLAESARLYLIECCERMAFADGLTRDNTAYAFIRDTLLTAMRDPDPEPLDNDSSWDSGTPSWGSPSPRVSAAEGLMALAHNPALIDDEIRAGIETLLGDPHPAVRFQIVTRCLMFWKTDGAMMWRLIAQIASTEEKLGVLGFFMDSVLLRIPRAAVPEAEQSVLAVYSRTRRDPRAGDIRERAAVFFLRRALWEQNRKSEARLKVYANAPLSYASELGRIIYLCRDLLVHDDAELDPTENLRVRAWAVRYLRGSLVAILKSLATIRSQAGASRDWPENAIADFRTLHSLADSVGNQVYFASGAFDEKQGRDDAILSPERLERYATEIDPLLELLCDVEFVDIAYNVLKVLQYLAPVRPERVFRLLGKLVANSCRDGIQYESMATDLVVNVVEEYLAQRRGMFRDPEMRDILLDVLDRFVEAGWPKATRLTFRLSEVYR